MMPGQHIPPAGPGDSRRQGGYPYHHLPPQHHGQSPLHNPYAHYPPPHHGPPPAQYYPPPQWYPSHYQPQHFHHHPTHIPRQFVPAMPPPQPQMQHTGPVIVSSSPHPHQSPNMIRPQEKSPIAEFPRPSFEQREQQREQQLAQSPQPLAPSASSYYPSPAVARSVASSTSQQYATQHQQLESPLSHHIERELQPHSTETPATNASSKSPALSATLPLRPSNGVSAKRQPRSRYIPKYPQLPWLSVPDQPFPPKASGARRKRRRADRSSISLILPNLDLEHTENATPNNRPLPDSDQATVRQISSRPGMEDLEQVQPAQAQSDLETPITSEAPSEANSTHPTTPSSVAPPQQATPRQATHARTVTKPVIPALPKVAVPNVSPIQRKTQPSPPTALQAPREGVLAVGSSLQSEQSLASAAAEDDQTPASPAPKQPPSSWAALFQAKNAAAATSAATDSAPANGVAAPLTTSLADVLRSFNAESSSKFVFLEPRGLKNTGNMCYMNSILQVLVFCMPFYSFLDQVGRQSTHSFKTDTPLLDALEFRVIDSAATVEQLRLRLKDKELELYGDGFSPDSVYDVIRRLPRFSSMRRGHQQDAEEFLGFLLAGLHDECARLLGPSGPALDIVEPTSPTSQTSSPAGDGWMEVGPKQKAAITRTSGHVDADSPITKIFGGHLRSELRVPGSKNSVTLEPYQPLQLDIGASNVNNIIDALKNLTKPEAIQGDWKSARGSSSLATKQVFIDTLPPVLILHLKRFQYNNTGGTQKIWKKVGYPLELEIPKEVFPTSKRNKLTLEGTLPKYRLTSVVYHHGTSAAGGHYTVDVRRQEGREWIRIDDLYIRRVRSKDVAEAGAEEDPKVLAAALENHKDDLKTGNIYDTFEQEEEKGEEGEWNQVNGMTNAQPGKNWSAVANGTSTTGTATPVTRGERTPKGKFEAGGKIAYILIYQQIK